MPKKVPRTIFNKEAYTVSKKTPVKVYTKQDYEIKTPVTYTKRTPVTTYETRKEVEINKTPITERQKEVTNHYGYLTHEHDESRYTSRDFQAQHTL